MFQTLLRVILIGFSATMLGGCAHYQYDLVKPADLAQRIGTKAPVTFSQDGLEYQLQTASNRLVMQVYNRTNDPVKLIGSDSYVVDPHGESHPLVDRMIPPGSFIKLIMPPAPTQMTSSSPNVGLGIGFGVSSAGHYHGQHGYYGGGMYDDGPRYYNVYDPNDATYWKWNGETDARLVLNVEQGKGRITHEFLFHRVKM